MTNTAKILNFGRGNFTGQERNVADLDDKNAKRPKISHNAHEEPEPTKQQFKAQLPKQPKKQGRKKPTERSKHNQSSKSTK
ncbi:hypothetical protein [Escherichia coli]|uniref:hypothetical protein n=1 Tax=Escherichia coli TaxID=562 RepID=UPI000A3BF9E5|nr:hypothetical protein [Escherichia coli]